MLSLYYRSVGQDERPIRYFAQDESRFGLHTIIERLITACGVKPIGQWQWLFKAFWLYGAVEPATGESFFWQFSHVDTQCYQRFLDEFSHTYPESLNILQVDNGRFHKGKDLRLYSCFREVDSRVCKRSPNRALPRFLAL